MTIKEKEMEENYFNAKKSRQYLLLFVCWLVYMFAQLGRYSYNSNTTLIMDRFSIDHTAAGLPATMFFFAYGIGQLVVGVICSKYNKRIVISLALVVSGLINLVIFLGIDFIYVKYLWFLNGIAQANLWPVLLLVLRENIAAEKMPIAAIVMSTASTGGRFVAVGVCALFAIDTSIFTYSFFVASMALFAMAAVWLITARNVKEPIRTAAAKIEAKKEKTKGAVDGHVVFLLIVFAEFSMASYAITGGLQQWVPSILKENFGLTDWVAIFMSVLLPLFTMTASFISAFMYNKIKNYVTISLIMFTIGLLILGLTLALLDYHWLPIIITLTIDCVSMSVVLHITSTQVPLMLEGKLNAGFLAGFLNGCCYIGMALSTYVLGSMADVSGWVGAFVLLMGIAFVSLIISIVYLIVEKVRAKEKQ